MWDRNVKPFNFIETSKSKKGSSKKHSKAMKKALSLPDATRNKILLLYYKM